MYSLAMDFFLNWAAIALIGLVGAMSPGPDFVIVVRNSVVHSRKAGIMTGLGITLGVCLHMTYCVLGLAALIAQSVVLFSAIKWVGAAYLIYIGYKSLCSQGYHQDNQTIANEDKKRASAFSAFRHGLLTNLLNPKATLFFLALFTQVIDPHTPYNILLIYALTIVAIGFGWWLFVALVLTDRRIKHIFLGFSKWIDRICGGLMIGLGLKLVFMKAAS